jgi:alkyl sulfatase BDS1-like metallo-beta-lactamase superfamily hydrolase
VRGVVDEADVRSGKVKIIAPDAFMEQRSPRTFSLATQ